MSVDRGRSVTVGQLIRFAERLQQPDVALTPHLGTLLALVSLAAGSETLADPDVMSAITYTGAHPLRPELDAQAGQLAGDAFTRSGCEPANGEPLWKARQRGQAAEALQDALRAVRTADLPMARRLIDEALAGLGTE